MSGAFVIALGVCRGARQIAFAVLCGIFFLDCRRSEGVAAWNASLGVFLPKSFGADSFESVSLKKAEKEKYFSDFSAAASRIQKGK